MSNVLIESQVMTDIASAIREKNGTENTYLPSEMPQAVKDIEDTGVGSRQWWSDMCSQKTNYINFFKDTNITEIPPIDTSNVTVFSGMCMGCTQLVTAMGLNFSKSSMSINNVFASCSALVNFSVVAGSIKKQFNIADSPLLSDESIQSIIDGLADLTGSPSSKVIFHTDVVTRLTQEQVLQITNKNWSIG